MIFSAPPGPPYRSIFRTLHLQKTLFQSPFGSSGLERIGPRGPGDSRSVGLSLEPARAKWTLTLQGRRARGQSARARLSQMDFEASSFSDSSPVRSSLHFFPFFSSPTWAGKPLGEYSRRGGRPHVGACWRQIQPKSSPTWAIFGRISTFLKIHTHSSPK